VAQRASRRRHPRRKSRRPSGQAPHVRTAWDLCHRIGDRRRAGTVTTRGHLNGPWTAFSIGVAAAVIVREICRSGRSDAVEALLQLSAPLVVPIDDSTGHVSALGESHPAAPQLVGGRLIVPIENAGLGPAINIRGTLTANSGHRPSVDYAAIRVLDAGRRAPLVFGAHESLTDFELQLSYEDPAARSHHVDASWLHEHRSYRPLKDVDPLR
jgi:hypothetical protein